MSKLEGTDTIVEVMMKMSGGNPGALTALMEISRDGEKIDPQGFMGGLGAIMLLDTWGIYGTEIYILWNDKCNKDVRQLLMLMRATQMGMFSLEKLKEMAEDQSRQVNLTAEEWADLDEKVCEALTEFAKAS